VSNGKSLLFPRFSGLFDAHMDLCDKGVTQKSFTLDPPSTQEQVTMPVSAKLRPYASTYVLRRIRRDDCLHIDAWSYPLTYGGKDYYAIRFQFRRGGRGIDPLRELVFIITPDSDEEPKQVPGNHIMLTDMYLSEPVLMNGRERRHLAEWFTRYHHSHLRAIAADYPPNSLDCKSLSVRFHYFVNPDHDVRQGFKNWFSPPRR
jgi:hypothetical protein